MYKQHVVWMWRAAPGEEKGNRWNLYVSDKGGRKLGSGFAPYAEG